jgi:hypothetical protein
VGLDGGWVCSREQRGGMEGKVAVVCSQVEDLPLPTSPATFSGVSGEVPDSHHANGIAWSKGAT